MTIDESFMRFGPFETSDVYHIEKSALYQNIGKGIKTVEFVLLQNMRSLNFIEAKHSSPKPVEESDTKFDGFIDEIATKFLHSFNLYYSAILNRQDAASDIPARFKSVDNSTVSIRFLLVIKGHDISWLPPIQDALYRRMAAHITIWNSKIAVLNDKQAMDYHLVTELLSEQ